MYLSIDQRRCTGCQSCVLFCSFVHEGVIQPSKARLSVVDDPNRGFIVQLCRQCTTLFCAQACPTDAIKRETGTGAIRVDEMLCDGCGLCAEACPFHAIALSPDSKHALICDFCGGEPECVKVCAREAIVVSERPRQKRAQTTKAKG